MSNVHDVTYHNSLKQILDIGEIREDRTGVGTIGIFGQQSRYDLSKGFPLITTKKLIWESIVSELLWFLEGSTDERRLAEIRYGKDRSELRDKRTIWSDNYESFSGKKVFESNKALLGPVYGKQWREWENYVPNSIDQIWNVIEDLKKNPFSRRHIVSAWNVPSIEKMALPPCHVMFQFFVSKDKKLSCQLYQRSKDSFLGEPYNIASYALLTHMIAQVCDLEVGEFIHTTGDAHIYLNHIEQVKEQLNREPYSPPKLWLNPNIKNINDFRMDDIKILGYQSHESIKAKMAV